MLSKRVLLSVLILFATVFVLFMAFTLYSNFLLSEIEANDRALTAPLHDALDAVTAKTLRLVQPPAAPGERGTPAAPGEPGMPAAPDAPGSERLGTRAALILGRSPQDEQTRVLIEWCVYGKYAYLLSDTLPAPEVAALFDVLLFGSYVPDAGDLPRLTEYAQAGLDMVFTRLPPFEAFAASAGLRDFFGIDQAVDGALNADGAHLYGGFFLSGDRLYTHDDFYGEDDDMDIVVPYYTLRAGYDVYMTAILDDREELDIDLERMPPLLWRTVTGAGQVFAVNCDLFDGRAMLGVITAFVSHARDVCVYPIVNAQTVHVLNFPWLSIENSQAIADIYGHRPDTLASDVIWPSMVQVLSNFHKHANFYVSSQFDYETEAVHSQRLPVYYFKQILKQLSTMSLSLSQTTDVPLEDILSRNAAFFGRELPTFSFTSVYAGAFEPEALLPYIGKSGSVLERVTLVLSRYEDGAPILEYLDDGVLSARLTSDGFDYEARDDISMIALQTALGLRGQSIDMTATLFPKSDEDYWNKQSIAWSSSVTYFNEFEALDSVTLYEMEDRARAFLALEYDVFHVEDGIRLSVKNGGRPAYFIARLYGKRVASVEGGEATRLSDTAYLVRATEGDVTLRLEPAYSLSAPGGES